MITVYQPEVIQVGDDKSRLSAKIDIDGEQKDIWYEVNREYEKYLCHERADAFLCGILVYAMKEKHDIDIDTYCDSPVTEELLYNFTKYLIPSLGNTWQAYQPKIKAKYTSDEIESIGAVGTGLSCGIDSLHSVINHLSDSQVSGEPFVPKVTHLVVNNPNFHAFGKGGHGEKLVGKAIYTRSERFAEELGLPIILTDSNLREMYRYIYQGVCLGFAVYALRKLWKTYLFAAGYSFSQFKIINGDSERSDLLSTTFLSTRGLRFYSEGGGVSRVQKTQCVSEFPLAHKFLHVCINYFGKNCGTCYKCRRTMVTLDIINKLDDFREVFPVEYYNENVDEYLIWLAENFIKENLYAKEMEPLIRKGKHAVRFQKILTGLKEQQAATL